ncbi:hypothetical protein [Fictibacillus sp. 26RED30]|uniref:hypothetical protein n=1 Tax=Fictibacillus sp. 26RED30 TaxID=2745877 RepID=UPI0018CF5640|nr:hypothetical protein [Fictibacillus sp. 26RED30]MBH0161868.1 hypothetical protein [Fictibacillus sp. 26RED30]
MAVHSYIEILLLFSIFYYLYIGSTLNSPCTLSDFKVHSLEVYCTVYPSIRTTVLNGEYNELIKMILYSATVTFFNISYDFRDATPLAWKIAHVSQVIVSIVLVVLSLASYIGFTDKMNKKETKELLLIKYWGKRKDEKYIEILNKIEPEKFNIR